LRTILLIACLLLPACLFAQNPNEEQPADDEAAQSTAGPVQFSFKNRPSIRVGEFFNADIKGKWHLDFRGFNPPKWNPPAIVTALPETPPTFYITRARFGIKGRVTQRVRYEFERDMRQTFGSDHEWHPWKDNYVDVNVIRYVQVEVGKFKIPFGMEANLSEDRLDFAFKSRVSDVLSPARERGVMLHSKFMKNDRLEYAVGVFRYDGEGTNIHGEPTGGRTFAASLTGEPLRYVTKSIPKTIRHAYLGVSMTRGNVIPGLNGVHGSTFSNFTYYDHMYVQGARTRIGTEFSWVEGPFDLKGEYMHMSEERKQQGIRGEDLPDAISRGWYLMGMWTPLGKLKSKGAPKTPFLTGKGFGAVELSARYDILSFYSAPGPGLPSRSPRAPTILPNGERTWTFGPTWYLNHFVKIQAHAQREKLTDIERKAVFGVDVFWTGVIRLQLAM
jgi:phosphate-selective porin